MSTTAARVAIVTGGSRGIGREVVRRFAADGYTVVVNYASNDAEGHAAAEEVIAKGGQALAIRADVSDEVAIAALFDATEEAFGGVDVVVNAAGIMTPGTPLVDLDLNVLDRVMRINMRGAFVVAQQAARRLRRGGALITFSTSVTKLAHPGYSAYNAAKSAVEGMTLILARELRGRDVTVNTVAPGPTATDLLRGANSEEVIARMAAQPPLERLGQPEDIAEVVAFLAGPARWVNGQVLYPNGGVI
jgi:3-oxoacyl-[acyl-carrier protein] reductase